MTKVLDLYRAKVARGDFQRDPAQEQMAAKLDELADRLADSNARQNGWGRLFGLNGNGHTTRGLYIVGDVGRGKTMLMDLFFEAAPVRQKRRVHFHAFMADVHVRIHEWRQSKKRGAVRGDDPIAPVASALAAEAQLLCFDEFAVTDITDAMILGRLFKALFAEHVTVVATSNVEPENLYRDGLNRALFLPFIAMLENHMEVVRLDAARDFRYITLTEAAVWFSPGRRGGTRRAGPCFPGLDRGSPGSRKAHCGCSGVRWSIPEAVGSVARFPFAVLCEAPLGSTDYLAIARAFGTVVVDDIRVIRPTERDLAKRFITMVDTFYDERSN